MPDLPRCTYRTRHTRSQILLWNLFRGLGLHTRQWWVFGQTSTNHQWTQTARQCRPTHQLSTFAWWYFLYLVWCSLTSTRMIMWEAMWEAGALMELRACNTCSSHPSCACCNEQQQHSEFHCQLPPCFANYTINCWAPKVWELQMCPDKER